MMELQKPRAAIRKAIKLTGSKSISNRLLILNAVCGLDLSFTNLSDAEDTQVLQNALTQIHKCRNIFANPASLRETIPQVIDVHHAGTDMRFLTALLAITKGSWILTGSERIKQRPIGELVTALRTLGAEIIYLEKENYPPLAITGKRLAGGKLTINSGVSSQFISALLLIAPALPGGLELTLSGKSVSFPYIQMTLGLLTGFGASCMTSGNTITLTPAEITPPDRPVVVESDWSSASYWYSLCALSPGSEITLSALYEKSGQADAILPKLFAPLGVTTVFGKESVTLTHSGIAAKSFSFDFTDCPDIAQTLAVTCFGLGIRSELKGLSTLKIKETDRILALKTELEKCGALVEATDDTLLIHATRNPKPETQNLKPEINTYHDHRMAMSFAPLALIFDTISIADPGVVAKSYPAFWQDLKSAGFNVNLQP